MNLPTAHTLNILYYFCIMRSRYDQKIHDTINIFENQTIRYIWERPFRFSFAKTIQKYLTCDFHDVYIKYKFIY